MANPTFDIMTSAEPLTGEWTQSQSRAKAASTPFANPGGFRRPPRATYDLYRRIRSNPTVAMARIAGFAPIKAAGWSVNGEQATQTMKAFVHDALIWMRPHLLHHIRFALDYGWQAFEKVWHVRKIKDRPAMVYRKLKPLLPELTDIRINKETGAFAGIEQQNTLLGPNKSFLFTYDIEGDNFYGRSRLENVRQTWSHWNDTMERLGMLSKKVSGTIPILEYPDGESEDESGNKQDNTDTAVKVLQDLSNGVGVAFTNTPSKWVWQLLQSNPNINLGSLGNIKSWSLDMLETQSGHVGELLQLLQHEEKLMARGMLVPERSITEATLAGSRADSKSAADIALTIAADLQADILQCVNWYLVDPLLTVNFGPDAVGKVRIEAEPLQDEAKAFMRTLLTDVLKNPANTDLLLQLINVDAHLDQLGVQRLKDMTDVLEDALNTPTLEEQAQQVMRELGRTGPMGVSDGQDQTEQEVGGKDKDENPGANQSTRHPA